MSPLRMLILAAAAVAVLGAPAQAARRGRGRRSQRKKWVNKVRKEIEKESKAGEPGEGFTWLTDFEEAAELAGKGKRPLMVLFTTEAVTEKSTSCRFKAGSTRRAVLETKVVPVRILPPAMLETRGLPKEEAAKRRELYAKAKEKYGALVKRFAVSTAPSLVFAAPDAARLTTLITPSDEQVRAVLGRLGEMVESHYKAAGKKPGDGGDEKAKAGKDEKKGDGNLKTRHGDQKPTGDGKKDPPPPDAEDF